MKITKKKIFQKRTKSKSKSKKGKLRTGIKCFIKKNCEKVEERTDVERVADEDGKNERLVEDMDERDDKNVEEAENKLDYLNKDDEIVEENRKIHQDNSKENKKQK